MSPALGGFNPKGVFGGLRGEKPEIPQAFFQMEAAEIIALLIGMGYSEKNAKVDVGKFMEYKKRITGPRQVFKDDEDASTKEPSEELRSFGGHIGYLKGGRDGK